MSLLFQSLVSLLLLAILVGSRHREWLGLASSLEVVRRYGGSIEVDSEAGRGTVFCLVLPLVIKDAHRAWLARQ